jgi:small subunit ribosomal protein S10e
MTLTLQLSQTERVRSSIAVRACFYDPLYHQLTQYSLSANNLSAYHDHLKTEQAYYLREPFQGYASQLTPHLASLMILKLLEYTEGVLVAKKDFNAPAHEDLAVPNLQVIKAMQSLTSKGFVKTQFSWQWYYYVLTPEGVEHLREWSVSFFLGPRLHSSHILPLRLHLPNEIVPATHKKAVRSPHPARRPGGGPGGPGSGEGTYRAPRGDRGDRDDYRKKEGAGGDFRPQFSGVGRGAPRE